jgi:zinc protease
MRSIAITLAAAAALAWASPARAQQLTVPATVDTLPNGLTLIVHEDTSAPLVSVNLWYHVGSGDEQPGRTGFAHLFEHLMFTGSANAPYPQFDRLLEAAGANNNGSTTEDRTNYYESGPANALPLMLWLEADRMARLTIDSTKLDVQRDVVKNERRQNYENQPYGLVADHTPRMLYPAGHPYSWPTIGSMADLSAASLADVRDFFATWYAPNNATLVVAGNVRTPEVRQLVQKYFGAMPRGPAIQRDTPGTPPLARDTVLVLQDEVEVPRLYLYWLTPAAWQPDDAPLRVAAYVLSGARSSRLDRRLLYVDESATSVSAYQYGRRLAGEFGIVVSGHPGQSLTGAQRGVDAELERLAREGPTARELETARNAIEARFLDAVERLDFKADQLNSYYAQVGVADGFQRDLDRIRAVTAADVQRVVQQYLLAPRAAISVVPEGKLQLAAPMRSATP